MSKLTIESKDQRYRENHEKKQESQYTTNIQTKWHISRQYCCYYNIFNRLHRFYPFWQRASLLRAILSK